MNITLTVITKAYDCPVKRFGSGESSERWYEKNNSSFDVTIANGQVTGFTARSRDDRDGVACEGLIRAVITQI